MPTYEYLCPEGHPFDKFQRMSDPPEALCPECGKDATRKISGGAGFLFKGDGFYITDSRSDAYKKQAGSDKADASPASDSSKKSKSSDGTGAKSASPSGSSGSGESGAPGKK